MLTNMEMKNLIVLENGGVLLKRATEKIINPGVVIFFCLWMKVNFC